MPSREAESSAPLARAEPFDDDDYLDQAHWAMTTLVPRTAAQSRIQIAQVLKSAAEAGNPAHDGLVFAVASAPRMPNERYSLDRQLSPRDARRLHDEARRIYMARGDFRRALDLELRAFGANPNDAEIAGQLALLHLRISPAQPERARLLALHALDLRSPMHPAGRPEDWITFAVASALTDRPIDATHALYASVALGRNAWQVCRAAIGALQVHGERLREPVEALIARLRTQGRTDGSIHCGAPPTRPRGLERLVESTYR